MNEYKITYIVDEGETEQTYITERTEAAARKFFKKVSGGGEIVDVELYNTNVAATKEQERETLEKIKAMVAELGPGSYVATAFEGVFEIAELNIRDDAAYSLKARVESAKERFEDMESSFNIAKSDAAHLKAELTSAREELEALRGKQLPAWLHSAAYSLACEELTAARQRMEETAETMADLADAPQDVAFAAAVKNYRAAKERREVCEQIVAGLEALTEK